MMIQDKSDRTIAKVFGAAFLFCAVVYSIVAAMGLHLYGA